MGRKAGGKDFSPRVRSLFDIAIKETLANGTLLPKLKEQLLEDPAGTIQKMSGYAPKQVNMDIDQKVTVDTTKASAEDWSIVAEIRKQLSEPSVTH
jgi:hypothetical protein